MTNKNFLVLADKIEAALDVEEGLKTEILGAMHEMGMTGDIAQPDLDSTDDLLAIVNIVLPGWTVSVKGKAWQPNGHWTCSLRKTSSRDSDEFIGVGRAPTLPHALLAALLRVRGQQLN